eukprot:403351490
MIANHLPNKKSTDAAFLRISEYQQQNLDVPFNRNIFQNNLMVDSFQTLSNKTQNDQEDQFNLLNIDNKNQLSVSYLPGQESSSDGKQRKFSIMRRSFNAVKALSSKISGKGKANVNSSQAKYTIHEDQSESNKSQSQKDERTYSESASEDMNNLKMQLPEAIIQLMLQPRRDISFKDQEQVDSQNQKSLANLHMSGGQFPEDNNEESFDDNLLQKALAIEDNDFNSFMEKTQDLTVQQKTKLPILIFSYKSKYRMYWDLVIILLALYNCIMIPIEISYGDDFFNEKDKRQIGLFEYSIDALFGFDILMSFRTSYLNVTSGKEITSSRDIAQRYIKSGGLAFDLISTIPIDDLISQMIPPETAKHLGLLGLIKMTRMLRLRKIITFMNVQQSLKVSLRMFQLILFLLLVVHWTGCIWYLLVMQNETEQHRWKPVFDSDENKDDFYNEVSLYQYLVTFYYAVLILIGRANEMAPISLIQTVFCSFIIIMGSFVSTFIFGNIAATMENATKKDSKLSQRLSLIQTNMAMIRLPEPLQDEVIKYVMQVEQAPEVQYDLNMFLDTLSPSLKASVLNYLHNQVIYSLEEFREAHEVEINFIANNLKTLLVLPENTVVQYGSSGEDMYFVINGKLSVTITRAVSKQKANVNSLIMYEGDSSQGSPILRLKKNLSRKQKRLLASSQSSHLQAMSMDDSFENGNNRIQLNLQSSVNNLQLQSPLGKLSIRNQQQASVVESPSIIQDLNSMKSIVEENTLLDISRNIDLQQNDKQQAKTEVVVLNTLEQGQFFGEIAILSKMKRTATVKAIEFSTLSSLSKTVMDTLKEEHPQIYLNFKRKLKQYTDDEMVMRRQIIANIPFFKKISDELVNELIYLLRETIYDGGNLVIKHGDLSDRIHIIWKGSLKVEIFYNGQDHLFEKLNKGGCFCVFSAFSDDYTQIFDFKVISSKAVILTLKASDLTLLAKSNLELADILKSLEVSIKKHQKSDFDFFRFIKEHPMHKSEEYRRLLRLKFQVTLRQIASNLINKTQKLTEPLLVVQQICKERKIREQQMKMIMFKKDDYYNQNNQGGQNLQLPHQKTLEQQNKQFLISQSSKGYSSDQISSSIQSSSMYMSKHSLLNQSIKNPDQLEREEKITIQRIEDEQKQKRKVLIQDILNPLEVPGIDLRIFDRIQGLPKDQNMFTQQMIEQYENYKARVEKQHQTRENVQFLNRLIFNQNSQIQQLKKIFDKQLQQFELKISDLAQQSRKQKLTQSELINIEKRENEVNINEYEKYAKKQTKLKDQYFQSFGAGCHQINLNTINIKNQINNYITFNNDGSFTKKTIYLNTVYRPNHIDNLNSQNTTSQQDILTHTDVSQKNLHSDNNLHDPSSLQDLISQQIESQALQTAKDLVNFKIGLEKVRPKTSKLTKTRKPQKPLNGEQLQDEINLFAFDKKIQENNNLDYGEVKTKINQQKQRHFSNLVEVKPEIDSLYQSQYFDEGKLENMNPQANIDKKEAIEKEDFSSVLNRVASLAQERQKVLDTPKSYQKYVKNFKSTLLSTIEKNEDFMMPNLNQQSKTNLHSSILVDNTGGGIVKEDSLDSFKGDLEIGKEIKTQKTQINTSSMPEIQHDLIIDSQFSIEKQNQFMTKRAQSKYLRRNEGCFGQNSEAGSQLQMIPLPERPQTRDQKRFRLNDRLLRNQSKGGQDFQELSLSEFTTNLQSRLRLIGQPDLNKQTTYQSQNKNSNTIAHDQYTDFGFYNQNQQSQNQFSSSNNLNQSSAFTIKKLDKHKYDQFENKISRFNTNKNTGNEKDSRNLFKNQGKQNDESNDYEFSTKSEVNVRSRAASAKPNFVCKVNNRLFNQRSQSPSSNNIKLSEKDKERWDFYRNMINQSKQ